MEGTSCNAEPREQLVECLSKQLSELELFQAMYPPRDIIITNAEVLRDIQNFLVGKTDYIPNHLDYTLKIEIEEFKLELLVHLPSLYPDEPPEIYIRCNQLNRQAEKSLNIEVTEYLKSKLDGEVCIYTAILWLPDNIEKHRNQVPSSNDFSPDSDEKKKFARFWIYSHHIYAKKKREDILQLAKDYSLTGFCLVGKPGIICVEGTENDCNAFWRNVKNMQWQKIGLRKMDTFDEREWAHQQRFARFNEVVFRNPATQHTDMGSFHKFIQKHDLLDAFNEFFGLCDN